MPVIFPGFSWHNLWAGSHPPNEIPRLGGNFYWKQFHNAVSSGCEMIYNAMFDEMDEGTSMFKMAATKAEAPVDCKTLTMDADGYKLPSDWYLRLAGTATKVLRGELPVTDKMPLDPLNPD
jgi:hypothetical protein